MPVRPTRFTHIRTMLEPHAAVLTARHDDPPMIVRSIRAGDFVRINSAFLRDVGFTREELAQKPLAEWLMDEDRQAFQDALDRGEKRVLVGHKTKDGGVLRLEVRMREQGDQAVVLGRAASGLATVSLEDPETIASVKSTLHKIAEIVEEQNPGYKCSILLVADGRFVKGAGPSLPDDYNDAVDGYAIGPTVGACGTAIYWNVPVIVEDIQNDPLWADLAALAKKAGVAACWSHPFVSNSGRVLGALALYSPVPRTPTAEQLSSLHAAAQMTGLAVERGRAEEALRSANAVKARFMANMSHEIRTPLNALIGITESLQGEPEPSPRSELQLLRESGEQLLELFTGVMELTEGQDRVHAGEAIDFSELCRTISEPLAAAAVSKGVQFLIQMPKGMPQWVLLDAWSFERALRHLTHNAVKFTSRGSVTVTFKYDDEKLDVRIADTGCGIDLGRLSELRVPFVQGDQSTTKEHTGVGLGLALSDLCVRALGGELKFSAGEVSGTTVHFCIPVRAALAPRDAVPLMARTRDRQRAKHPVLVVEDNPLNSRIIEKMLKRSGYECQIAENGEEALLAMKQSVYSGVLMDCQMPIMDGYEAARRIREREQGSDERIPIIAVTANALAEDRGLCLQAGMDEYLKKPVRTEELIAVLEKYVGRPSSKS